MPVGYGAPLYPDTPSAFHYKAPIKPYSEDEQNDCTYPPILTPPLPVIINGSDAPPPSCYDIPEIRL